MAGVSQCVWDNVAHRTSLGSFVHGTGARANHLASWFSSLISASCPVEVGYCPSCWLTSTLEATWAQGQSSGVVSNLFMKMLWVEALSLTKDSEGCGRGIKDLERSMSSD